MTDPATDTAVAINSLQNAVSSLSVDVLEIKTLLKSQNERFGTRLDDVLQWRAAHDASSAARASQYDMIPGRVATLENKLTKVEERQDTARLITIPTIVATIAAFVKAFFFDGKS